MGSKNYPAYSALMSVYYKENPEWFSMAIDSIVNQTIKPSEFVIICDGKLTPALENVILNKTRTNNIFKIVRLEKNVGLGPALARGIDECSNEYIARMDSDDYCVPERIEKQFEEFKKDSSLGLVGSNVEEFMGDINNVISHVILPEDNESIIIFSKKRCPFRHPALLYRKSVVLQAGNYRECYLCEDYDLYVRMLQNKCKCKNIQKPLTYMRISEDFYKRRGGIKYAKSIMSFKRGLLRSGYYTKKDYIKSALPHLVICLLPNLIRKNIYKKLLRGGRE